MSHRTLRIMLSAVALSAPSAFAQEGGAIIEAPAPSAVVVQPQAAIPQSIEVNCNSLQGAARDACLSDAQARYATPYSSRSEPQGFNSATRPGDPTAQPPSAGD
jgi:hypothetical protein